MLSEIASLKAYNEPEQSRNYISEINYKSRDMITAMDDMLWSINPANDTTDKFIARAKEYAASLSISHNVIIKLQADKQAMLLKPDMKMRHELMLLYKQSLNWLVNELHAPQTIIQLNYIGHHLQMNMFAQSVEAGVNQKEIEKDLKERAAFVLATADVLNDDKDVGILISVKA